MNLAFVNFKDFAYGGYLAFLYHLMGGLESFGHRTEFFYIGNKPKKVYRELEIKSRNCPLKRLPAVLNKFDIVIVPSGKAESGQENLVSILKYVNRPKVLVVHDPPEVTTKGGLSKHFGLFQSFLFIRPLVRKWFINTYPTEKYNTWIPHPYNRFNPDNNFSQLKKDLVVDTARVDWDKHQDVLIRAAEKIKAEVKIYSGFVNTRYIYHKCKGLDFNKYYGGSFRRPVDVLREAKIMVDLSAIQHDGGGTQYTFLEAMDAECVPVISQKWIKGKSLMEHNRNCIVAPHEAEGLAMVINNLMLNDRLRAEIIANNIEFLKLRSWQNIIPKYVEYFDKVIGLI